MYVVNAVSVSVNSTALRVMLSDGKLKRILELMVYASMRHNFVADVAHCSVRNSCALLVRRRNWQSSQAADRERRRGKMHVGYMVAIDLQW